MLRIFGLPVSQPARAVIWPCLLKGLPFKLEMVAPYSKGKRGCKSTEYLKMNPAGQIPTIEDDGFCLGESMAILQYLAEKHKWSDLYPSDLHLRSRIHMYMHFHHRNVREASAGLIAPLFNESVKLHPAVQTERLANFRRAIQILDENWLTEKDFLVGDLLTLADIAAYSELGQLLPRYLNLWDFKENKNLNRWMYNLSQVQFHDEIHVVLEVLGDLSQQNYKAVSLEKMIEANKTGAKKLMALIPSVEH